MDLLQILKLFVFTISFVMFCYQLNTATINLMDPPTVDSTNERSINEDDMPLITVCPTHQSNFTRIRELGYPGYDYMLWGDAKCYETTWCTSWGGHLNLTFDELKEQVLDLDKVEYINMYKGGEFKNRLVFLPGYGLCKETKLLNYTQEIVLYHENQDDIRVFITTRNYRSYFMPNTASHKGKAIFMKPKTTHYVNVDINERDNCKNDEYLMSEEDYKKCVDDKILNEFEKSNISCIPPWLSCNKQCNQTYPDIEKFYGKFYTDFHRNYFLKLVFFKKNLKFEDECRQKSCKETTYVVDEEGSRFGWSSAFITFNQRVIVTEKVPNYDMFKYIIDVGSSLGLWLGLSVLGLHELFVWAVQFVNNSFIIKKIRSAVTK